MSRSFEPFGKDWSSSPTLLRFPGQWSDAAWNGNKGYGFYYNVNRWYEDGRGLYTQPDPLGLTDGPNPYLYVEDRPTRFTDPEGLFLKNDTNCTLYVKESTRGKTHAVKSGGIWPVEFDGYADPCKHPKKVFKATDLVDVTVGQNHAPRTSIQDNVPDRNRIGHTVLQGEGSSSSTWRGGWHDSGFNDDLHNSNPPDHGWDELFDKADPKNCSCSCKKAP
jgi:RHS repeat-associated protein